MELLKSAKKLLLRIRFAFKSAAYMRVSYVKPRSVVMLTSRWDGKDNVMPMDWHMPVSIDPKLYCISLEKGNYTQHLIRASGFFVVNFMPSVFEEKMISCGQISGKNSDKFTALGINKKEAVNIPVFVLEDALAHLECEVKNIHDVGDHYLVIGLVKYESMDFDLVKEQLYHQTKL